MVAHNDYYIYALFREDGITPFYIGKGRRGRWREHEAIALREGRTHKDRIIRKMLSAGLREIPKAKICESRSQLAAAAARRLLPDGLSKKLKAVDVASIRRLRENGATQISIARQFGVAQSVVSAIVARRIWTHV